MLFLPPCPCSARDRLCYPDDSVEQPSHPQRSNKGTKASSSGCTALRTDAFSPETRLHAEVTTEIILDVGPSSQESIYPTPFPLPANLLLPQPSHAEITQA